MKKIALFLFAICVSIVAGGSYKPIRIHSFKTCELALKSSLEKVSESERNWTPQEFIWQARGMLNLKDLLKAVEKITFNPRVSPTIAENYSHLPAVFIGNHESLTDANFEEVLTLRRHLQVTEMRPASHVYSVGPHVLGLNGEQAQKFIDSYEKIIERLRGRFEIEDQIFPNKALSDYEWIFVTLEQNLDIKELDSQGPPLEMFLRGVEEALAAKKNPTLIKSIKGIFEKFRGVRKPFDLQVSLMMENATYEKPKPRVLLLIYGEERISGREPPAEDD